MKARGLFSFGRQILWQLPLQYIVAELYCDHRHRIRQLTEGIQIAIITARFDGSCKHCGGAIKTGERVEWVPGQRGVAHAGPCPVKPADRPQPRTTAITARQVELKVRAGIAKREDIPRALVGTVTQETAKALYVEAHLLVKPAMSCHRCGRELTDPNSRLVGYGPDCCAELGLPRPNFDRMTAAELDELKNGLAAIEWKGWLPKSQVEVTDLAPAAAPAAPARSVGAPAAHRPPAAPARPTVAPLTPSEEEALAEARGALGHDLTDGGHCTPPAVYKALADREAAWREYRRATQAPAQAPAADEVAAARALLNQGGSARPARRGKWNGQNHGAGDYAAEDAARAAFRTRPAAQAPGAECPGPLYPKSCPF